MALEFSLDEITELNKDDERYFSCLYESRELGNSRLSTTELSKLINVHPSTVSNRIRILGEIRIQDYQILDYEKIYGAKLTYFGGIIAERIVRKKRIMETYLASIGFSLSEIDKQIKEIYVTEKMSEQIFKTCVSSMRMFSQDPFEVRCPHGGLIPDGQGRPKSDTFYPLRYFSEGTHLTIYRLAANIDIHNFDNFYQQVEKYNLVPGRKIIWIDSSEKETIFEDPESGNQFKVNQEVVDLIYFTDQFYNLPLLESCAVRTG